MVSWGHLPRHEGASGSVWGCWGLLGSQNGCSRVLKEAKRAPKTHPRAPETSPKRRNHDPSALSTFQSLRNHDLSALPSDYERREALERAAKSRSIGPVNVSEPPGAQNWNSGGLEAAILDTFITSGGLGPPPTRDILVLNIVNVPKTKSSYCFSRK